MEGRTSLRTTLKLVSREGLLGVHIRRKTGLNTVLHGGPPIEYRQVHCK